MIEFIGRFHLLILHLPIGIFVLVFFLEVYAKIKKRQSLQEAISIGLLIGMCTAILACTTGLMLANGGSYEGDLVDSHKWFAIGMTVLSVVVYFMHQRKIGQKELFLYTPSLLILMILLAVTGHKGGSITHGEAFLTGGSDVQTEFLEDVNEAVAYTEIIQPIIKTKCVSCHRSSKSKGDLILSDSLGILKGGKNGAVVVGGKIEESSLISRIHLPIEEEEHMPPKSKKQLTDDEKSLLEWWISEGASFTSKIKSIPRSEKIQKILEKYNRPKSALAGLNIEAPSEAKMKDLRLAGIPVQFLSKTSPYVTVNLAHNQSLSKSYLKKLKEVSEQLISLDLSFSNIDDQQLSILEDFPHLMNLRIQGTDITNKSIKNLSELKYLKTLNVYDTKIDDEVIQVIKELPSLESIYLWQTLVSSEAVSELRNDKPLLKVVHNEGAEIFGDANLRPPLIIAERDLFRDTLEVSLELNFKNVDFFYTIDGSDPDSTSTLYERPFVISSTSLVRAMTKKRGWNDSEISERQFVQSKFEIKDIVLRDRPSEKYKGSGEKTLVDFVKGSEQFTDGNWLGYEGEHLIATLDLGSTETIESVTVSALDATNSWIFYPVGMKIKTSLDGKTYLDAKRVKYPMPESMVSASRKNFTEQFSLRKARFIKIEVENILKNPDWHPNPGGKSWLFVDEILVN